MPHDITVRLHCPLTQYVIPWLSVGSHFGPLFRFVTTGALCWWAGRLSDRTRLRVDVSFKEIKKVEILNSHTEHT